MGRLAGAWLLAAALSASGFACSGGATAGHRDGGAGSGGDGGAGGPGGGGDGGWVDGCGDGIVEFGEQCDDGNNNPDDCCHLCHVPPPTYGNGIVECREQCDDGNLEGRDGCNEFGRYECLSDADCELAEGLICVPFNSWETTYGACEPGVACNLDSNCGTVDRERCRPEACSCVPSAAAEEDGYAGICRLRVESCGACRMDEECGTSVTYDRPAGCVWLERIGAEAQRVCLPRNLPSRTCPPGFYAGEGAMEGWCVPAGGSCPEPECRIPSDCPPGLTCDVESRTCVPRACRYDFAEGVTLGCPADRPACHVGQLDVFLLGSCELAEAFGAGWCGAACAGDADCVTRSDPRDGAAFVCREEGGVKRCRPPGCLDDTDCIVSDGPYAGLCIAETGACVFDECRLEPEPRHCGVAPQDCRGDTYCYPDASLPEGRGRCLPPRP